MASGSRSREQRGNAAIEDITYGAPDGSTVEAFLITPAFGAVGAASGPSSSDGAAGIVFWHWFDPKAPDGDRTQFIDEAVELAGDGVVSLLPQGRFPWSSDPSGAARDGTAIEAEVARLRAGLDLLAGSAAVEPGRLAVVGHDFGGMLATLAAAGDDRLRALVVIAATRAGATGSCRSGTSPTTASSICGRSGTSTRSSGSPTSARLCCSSSPMTTSTSRR